MPHFQPRPWYFLGALLAGLASLQVLSSTPATSAKALDRWEVHEWGTFTSMQGSNGKHYPGMHRDEEQLPHFVYALSKGPRGVMYKGLGWKFLPAKVTQKLETPVLYFYSSKKRKVTVSVRFPKGIISEWYPQYSRASLPARRQKVPKAGAMTWKGEVRPGKARFKKIDPTNVWMPSRQVPEATPFHTKGQSERFIFYRGVGHFEAKLKVFASKDQKHWSLHNRSSHAVPGGLVVRVTKRGGSWRSFGRIAPKGNQKLLAPPRAYHKGLFLTSIKRELVKQLRASGLSSSESWAMVQTWHHSYFETPGTRVLYIVPRARTDALLPIQITPKPQKLVRTLVGRIEFMTPRQERAALARFKRLHKGGQHARLSAPKMGLGRLLEPKLRRLKELLKDPSERRYCDSMLAWVRRR